MSATSLSALIYFLGFVGLAAVGLVPLRSWHVLLRAHKEGMPRISRFGRLLVLVLALAAFAALWGDVWVTVRIFKCLTETYCGPSVASGWTYLAMLGVWYLVFEAVVFVVRRLAQVASRKSASTDESLARG